MRSSKINVNEWDYMVVGPSFLFSGRMLPPWSCVAQSSDTLTSKGFPLADGGVPRSILPLHMSDYAPLQVVLQQRFGSPMGVMRFFLFIFAAARKKSLLSDNPAPGFGKRGSQSDSRDNDRASAAGVLEVPLPNQDNGSSSRRSSGRMWERPSRRRGEDQKLKGIVPCWLWRIHRAEH